MNSPFKWPAPVRCWRRLGCGTTLALAMLFPADLRAQPLSRLLPDLIGAGITLPNLTHTAHFENESSARVAAAINASLLTQLATSPPVSSTSGGFTWEFDSELGTYTQTTDTLGPIYAERPETIGKGKWNFGVGFYRFEYDSIDGISLGDGAFAFDLTHDDINGDGSTTTQVVEGDLIRTQLFLEVNSESMVFFGTWGATDHIDISVAVPVVSVELDGRLDAEVNRLATERTAIADAHLFDVATGATTDSMPFSGSASGVGDVIVRGKYRFKEKSTAAVVEVRLPTGDEDELLGAGGTQIKLSLIGAKRLGPITPHINVGYTISSGGGTGGALGELPNEFNLIAGFEAGLGERVSLAVDLISRTLFDAPRLEAAEENHFYVAPEQTMGTGLCRQGQPTGNSGVCLTTRQTIGASSRDLNLSYASAGLKIKLSEHVLLTGNLLYSVASNGLQDEGLIPLLGLDYSF